MKTELVNLLTNNNTETVVLLTTELDELDELAPAERVRALELAIWLINEGWTVMTTADSPLGPVVRKGAEATHDTCRSYDDAASGRIETAGIQLPPHHRFGRSVTSAKVARTGEGSGA